MSVLLCAVGVIMQFENVRSLRLSQTPHQMGRRQFIPVGLPLDAYDDVYRDLAVDEKARRHVKTETHFFADTDCRMFVSREICEEARKRTTYLATYPCSGNTWTRYMFEHTLLIYTGSVFCDQTLMNAGMNGECDEDPSKVFLVKTHWPLMGGHAEGNGEKNLVVVRDPLHAALSYITFHLRFPDHTAEIPKKQLQKEFDGAARQRLTQWAKMARVYRHRMDVHVVRYEDIVANTRESYLTDIFPYVGVNSDNPEVITRLSSAIESSNKAYGTIRRNHSYVFEFTDSHKQLVREIVGKNLANHYGYEV